MLKRAGARAIAAAIIPHEHHLAEHVDAWDGAHRNNGGNLHNSKEGRRHFPGAALSRRLLLPHPDPSDRPCGHGLLLGVCSRYGDFRGDDFCTDFCTDFWTR